MAMVDVDGSTAQLWRLSAQVGWLGVRVNWRSPGADESAFIEQTE